METGDSYLKHRTYIDNVSDKYIELDVSQNLALWPKDKVQSACLSGKQFTLHFAIVDLVKSRYHFHLSDDTNHDEIFVDHVIRDIDTYDIKNENMWIHSDNASSQYKNKHSFSFFKNLLRT